MDHGWRKLIPFCFIVLLPATVVGISNFFVFPDSALSATLMLIVTVGVAAIFTWQSGNATRKIARYCIFADILICIILCINLGGHWLLAREVSAAKQGVEERNAEEDRQLEREKEKTKLAIDKAKAETDLARAEANAAYQESQRLKQLPIDQRRARSAPRKAAPQQDATPTPEPTATPQVVAAAPKLTPDQVREKWRGFLSALAYAEIFASVLAGAILAGIWEWDRDHDGVADHKQRPKTVTAPSHTVEGLARAAREQSDPK
jgi:hypothetical protein